MSASPPDEAKPDPYVAFRNAGFRRFLLSNFAFNLGRQAMSITIALQVLHWTNSAAAIGFIGLVNVIPLIFLVLPSGVLADKYDRRKIITITMSASCALSIMLVMVTHFHDCIPYVGVLRGANHLIETVAHFFTSKDNLGAIHFDNPALPIVYLLQLLHATVRVVGAPARGSIIPVLVPPSQLTNALTWNSSTFELSAVLGPVLGGFVAVWSYTAVYAADAVFSIVLAVSLVGIALQPRKPRDASLPVPKASAGATFIWRQKPVLAAITLDLFAVLLGGLTAMYPLYAKNVFHFENYEFWAGCMRAAPSVGAIMMAVFVAHSRPFKRPGITLLWSVVCFGAAIVIFALSRNIFLSLFALFLTGICDNVSVVIRHTLVQMLTPDYLRGRVTSVNQLFIGCSNEISEFRGGLMAARFGPVAAATFGGVCTIMVVVSVALSLPAIRTVPPLNEIKPVDPEPEFGADTENSNAQ
ncbi:MFS family permease [Ereboglobus sp. PH5-5]|uniref:MFS transporter n=1 Tax=Ereboglobus sp. PH5-5 TaxID=2940529 RepID=UPI002406C51D|nr:MFS transporter [Ereboglobus sp. PH5-5]MDF9832391.1 MFS family permease [Ereboglobus sp. PH5-5]